jgi:uroporphyrinogen decarboxylase
MGYYWLGEMDPLDRWKAYVRGEQPDRVGLFPLVLGFDAIAMGYPNLGDFYKYPKVNIKCQMAARELFGWDQPVFEIPIGYFGAEWGSKMHYPYGPKEGSITCADPIVKKPEDVDKLEIPDVRAAPTMQETYDWIKMAIDHKAFPIINVNTGWFTSAAPMIVEVADLMLWIIRAPDVVHKLLDKTSEFGIATIEYYAKEFGTDTCIPMDATPTDSNVLVSPDVVKKFSLPRAIKVHKRILELGYPMMYHHWCADHRANVEAGVCDELAKYMGKPGMFNFGPEVPIKLQVERFGKKVIVMGNIDPPSLQTKSYDEVTELAKKELEIAKDSPKGYIMGVGCEFPPHAPPMNMYAMLKVCREYGKY